MPSPSPHPRKASPTKARNKIPQVVNNNEVWAKPSEPPTPDIETLYADIRQILLQARENAYRAVNAEMVQAYWQIGRVIVEQEQRGEIRAKYGEGLLKTISKRLSSEFGKGFDYSNIKHMRHFYLAFPKGDALRRQLSWTHYRILLKAKDEAARQFYMEEAVACRWTYRELERQIGVQLYERTGLSKVMGKQLVDETQETSSPSDLIRDPYYLHFLGLEDRPGLQERTLENAIMDNLQRFILELGKGFAFVGRQYRIVLDEDVYRVDLVFFNYILNCFVLIDLKTRKLSHADTGQMDFYVRYFEAEIKEKHHKPTIGLILCTEKSKKMAQYTLLKDSDQIFASEYRLYLPSEAELSAYLTEAAQRLHLEQELESSGEHANG